MLYRIRLRTHYVLNYFCCGFPGKLRDEFSPSPFPRTNLVRISVSANEFSPYFCFRERNLVRIPVSANEFSPYPRFRERI